MRVCQKGELPCIKQWCRRAKAGENEAADVAALHIDPEKVKQSLTVIKRLHDHVHKSK